MKIIPTAIPDVLIIEPKVFGDTRGFFFESFNQAAFNQATGFDGQFVQDNHSKSAKNVLRGLHYQIQQAQGKLVRVTQGAAFDVAVDIRLGSPTFGQWVGVELTCTNHKMLWIPEGFAHGFIALADNTHFHYKTTDYYAKDCEAALRWDDSQLAIQWPQVDGLIVNHKDQHAPLFSCLTGGN